MSKKRVVKGAPSSYRSKAKTKPRHSFSVEGRTPNQKKYIKSIVDNVVTLCSGFAGTGKTLLAIGMALQLVQSDQGYSKVYIVRPAIEACGESIGYLPGGIDEKMSPFIQPVLDNLRVFVKDEGRISTLFQTGTIEVIPMGFLRGRTFTDCVVVFDEAQNASPAQMKLFLTRIGENCKVIIEGDVTQSDTFKDRTQNGLHDAIRRLGNCKNVGIVLLELSDIQRNKIIGDILERYSDIGGI